MKYCKRLSINEPLLQYLDFTKPFSLTTDASNFAVGDILSQTAIGSDKSVAYTSRTLNETEIKYSVMENEML